MPRRRPVHRLAGLALVAMGLPAPAPAQSPPRPPRASEADPRVDPNAWPLTAVGKLNVVTGPGSRQHCTATLIGRRHVLTAAHCLWDRARAKWVDPAGVHFVAGYRLGSYTAHATAAGWTRPEAYRFGTDAADLADDWAVVALNAEIPLKPIPRAADPTPAPEGGAAITGILHAGYRFDANQVMSAVAGCSARLRPAGPPLLLHACPVVPGESGSALIVQGADGPAVAGILVAGARAGGVSLAVPVASVRAAAQAALAGEDASPRPSASQPPADRTTPGKRNAPAR